MFWVRQQASEVQRGEQPGVAACVPGLQMMYGPRRGHTGESRERREEKLKTWSRPRPDSVWCRIICHDSGGEYFLRSKRLKRWLSELKTPRTQDADLLRFSLCIPGSRVLASLARHLNVAHSRGREFITDNLVVKVFCKLHTSVTSYLCRLFACRANTQTRWKFIS